MVDDWLKGVLAGAGAVLVASAWTMRQTAKTVRSEAEGSLYELFPRENAEVGASAESNTDAPCPKCDESDLVIQYYEGKGCFVWQGIQGIEKSRR